VKAAVRAAASHASPATLIQERRARLRSFWKLKENDAFFGRWSLCLLTFLDIKIGPTKPNKA
jgi:hypothetical protein